MLSNAEGFIDILAQMADFSEERVATLYASFKAMIVRALAEHIGTNTCLGIGGTCRAVMRNLDCWAWYGKGKPDIDGGAYIYVSVWTGAGNRPDGRLGVEFGRIDGQVVIKQFFRERHGDRMPTERQLQIIEAWFKDHLTEVEA